MQGSILESCREYYEQVASCAFTLPDLDGLTPLSVFDVVENDQFTVAAFPLIHKW